MINMAPRAEFEGDKRGAKKDGERDGDDMEDDEVEVGGDEYHLA